MKRPRPESRRHGAATVEFALCVPLIVLLALGAIEACSLIYLKQDLTVAAYEGGRFALAPGAKSAEVVAEVERVLTARGVQSATVTVSPSDLAAVPIGGYLSITVSAPFDSNAMLPSSLYDGQTLTARVEPMKEYE